MNQVEREQRRQQEERQEKLEQERKDHMKFLTDSFRDLMRWQIQNNCIVIPFLSGPWMQGQFNIGADITFRKMTPEDKQMMEEQLAKEAGIILPK